MPKQEEIFPAIAQFMNNNNVNKRLGPVRCLFGVPDPLETRHFVETELRKHQQLFSTRWRHETDKKRPIENLENDENDFEIPTKRSDTSDDKPFTSAKQDLHLNLSRRVLQPRNDLQMHLTDYWTSKKSYDDRPQKYNFCPSQHFQQDLI